MRDELLNRRPLIAVTPTTQIDRRLSGDNIEAQNEYTIILAKIVDHLVETMGALVVLIPNETQGGYDDVHVIKKIFAIVRNKSDVRVIAAEYRAEELKGLIAACDLLIGSRYHSIIAATSMCVPTVAIGWGHKYNEVMKMLGLSDFEFDFRSMDYERLRARIARLWHVRDKIKSELELKIPLLKSSVMSGGELVAELTEAHGRSRWR